MLIRFYWLQHKAPSSLRKKLRHFPSALLIRYSPCWRLCFLPGATEAFSHLLQLHTVHFLKSKSANTELAAVSQKATGEMENIKRERSWRLSGKIGCRERRLASRWRCITLRASSGLWGSAAVFSVISTATWWSAGTTGGYRMTSVYTVAATWAQTVESQDVSFRGTIDPTVRVGWKPGRSNHIRPSLKGAICQECIWIIHNITVEDMLMLTERTYCYHRMKTVWFLRHARKLLICSPAVFLLSAFICVVWEFSWTFYKTDFQQWNNKINFFF